MVVSLCVICPANLWNLGLFRTQNNTALCCFGLVTPQQTFGFRAVFFPHKDDSQVSEGTEKGQEILPQGPS